MRCPVCDQPLRQPQGKGRTRQYCSERCRLIAWRRRRLESAEGDLEPAFPEVEIEIPGPEVTNPADGLATTLGTIIFAKGRLVTLAPRVESRLAWRCTEMAKHIQAGLDAYFK